jgi:DNA-3-methyladenine glycosylase I
MSNPGIIRNRLKIEAAVENARRIRRLQREHGSFAAWLGAQSAVLGAGEGGPWVKLFKKTFVFTGGEITTSFLMSVGYLPGAHEESCPVYRRILKKKPAWLRAGGR